MPKTIRAVFEQGLFRPTEPVDLPDRCEVEFEPRAVDPGPQWAGVDIPKRLHPRAAWDDIFALKLCIGSAPPVENEDAVEVTGDDFLF